MHSRYFAFWFCCLAVISHVNLQRCESRQLTRDFEQSAASTGKLASENDAVIHFNDASATLSIFTNWNQELTQGTYFDAIAIGAPATVVSDEKHGLNLYKGTLVVKSGKSHITVRLAEGNINLSPQSTVIIEYSPRKSLQIQLRNSPGNVLMKVFSGAHGDAQFRLKNNEQLNADFTTCKITMQARQDLGETAEKCFNAAKSNSQNKKSAALMVSGSTGTEIRIMPTGIAELVSGRIFVRTSSGSTIHTSLGDATLRQNAVASIERWDGQLRLASFSEPDAISYHNNEFERSLGWGQELVATEKPPLWGDLLPDDGVARRNFRPLSTEATNYTVAEFQLASALKNQPQLLAVRKPGNEFDSKLKKQLLKTAIALEFVSGAKGRFVTARDLSTTALSQQ